MWNLIVSAPGHCPFMSLLIPVCMFDENLVNVNYINEIFIEHTVRYKQCRIFDTVILYLIQLPQHGCAYMASLNTPEPGVGPELGIVRYIWLQECMLGLS